MELTIALVVAGLAILLIAGDLLVRGAVGLATALKISPLVVSLTIVAFGTSAPEMVVSAQAVLAGTDGIALGNIIGSNIANVLLVLGLPALIYPIATAVNGLKRHCVIMLIATGVMCFYAYGSGTIDFTAGCIFFAGILGYVIYIFIRARNGADEPVMEEVDEYADTDGLDVKTVLFIVAGLIGLPLGASLLVENGSSLAANLGVREELIGLTIIAFGTSLPELATVVAAALHKKADVAIGGVIGSNIFNLLAVGGIIGMVGGAQFDPKSLSLDLPALVVAALAISFYVFRAQPIGKIGGLLFTATYLGFIWLLAVSSGLAA